MPKSSLTYPQRLGQWLVSLQGLRDGSTYPEIIEWIGTVHALSEEQARSIAVDRWANLEYPRQGYRNIQIVIGNI